MATLNERLKNIGNRSAPNLNPVDVIPPPKKEPEIIPDIREVITSVADRNKLVRLVVAHVALGQQEKEAKNAKKPLTTQIKSLMGTYRASKLMVDSNRINYYNAPRSSISRELLLQRGVSPKIIAACTKTTDSYTLKITAPGEEDEE